MDGTSGEPGLAPLRRLPAVRSSAQLRHHVAGLRPAPRDQVRFLVFAQGRSGSTLLTRILDSGDEVRCDEEILARPVWSPLWWPVAAARRAGTRAYGFKVKIYQLTDAQGVADPAAWLGTMVERGWKVIHLVRHNVVRQVLSNTVRNVTGTPHRTTDEPDPVPRVALDVPRFVAYLDARVRLQADERRVLQGIEHAVVHYEQDLLDAARHQAVLDRLRDHLDLPPTTLAAPDLRRTSRSDLRDAIENFDELERALRGTPYASMLSSP